MPWNVLDGRVGKGIRVTFKDGKTEDFIHTATIKYSAQVWSPEFLNDKTAGAFTVGYWGSDNQWKPQASFPEGSYTFVRVIM